MNCATHSETPATAYCRTCGKAMCASCTRTVRGVVYCEDCIAHRLQDTMPAGTPPPGVVVTEPPPGTPSPGLACVLGFIPGVGAMYNGQFTKAFIHVLIFASLIWATNREDFFGIFIPFFIFYMVFDAYKTAHARELGLPLPDPLGLEKMFGVSQSDAAPHVPSAAATPGAAAYDPYGAAQAPAAGDPQRAAYVAAAQPRPGNGPIGAVILIALGVLFLLSNLDIWNFDVGRFWPVILIAVGAWLFMRRWNYARPAANAPVPPPPAPAEANPPVQAREER